MGTNPKRKETLDELLHSFPLTFKKAPNKQGGGIEWEYLCRVALELKEGQETRCIVFWRKNMPRGILPSLKRKTNYQQPPMYVSLHSNQTNNLTFDCFECLPRQSLPTAPFTFLMSSAVRPVGLVCHSGQPLSHPDLTAGHSHSHTIWGSLTPQIESQISSVYVAPPHCHHTHMQCCPS